MIEVWSWHRAEEAVNEGTAQVEKVPLGSFFRSWPLSHYILDSPPGGPNDTLPGWWKRGVGMWVGGRGHTGKKHPERHRGGSQEKGERMASPLERRVRRSSFLQDSSCAHLPLISTSLFFSTHLSTSSHPPLSCRSVLGSRLVIVTTE